MHIAVSIHHLTKLRILAVIDFIGFVFVSYSYYALPFFIADRVQRIVSAGFAIAVFSGVLIICRCVVVIAAVWPYGGSAMISGWDAYKQVIGKPGISYLRAAAVDYVSMIYDISFI